MDRSTVPDEISGIKAPTPEITRDLVVTQAISTSTPNEQRKKQRFVFDIEDEVITADGLGDNENLEVLEDENDENSEQDVNCYIVSLTIYILLYFRQTKLE